MDDARGEVEGKSVDPRRESGSEVDDVGVD
jgi:hypothetical protein